MNLEPVPDQPAIVIEGDKRWVCIADLHIGVESALRASGFNIPSQLPKMASAIKALSCYGDRLLILGDVKHRITHATHREDRDLRSIMGDFMESYKAVLITPGNHDGGLRSLIPDGCSISAIHGAVVGGVGAFHGHVWPSEKVMAAGSVLMGHVHPSILLEGAYGGRTNEKCWMRAKLSRKKVLERYPSCPRELVVVPAFNPLIVGSPINASGGGRLGPLLRNDFVSERSLRVHLLDGTDLGRPQKR